MVKGKLHQADAGNPGVEMAEETRTEKLRAGETGSEPMTLEQIGNVTLDLSRYSGEDLYCDGAVEDHILEIAKSCREEDFDAVIRQEPDWPTFYHLSSIRSNIVSWIPFLGTEKVLEIGAGPGAITGALARKCAKVDCVELSHKRSLINAYRHQEYGNITIHVGNFEDIEPTLDQDYDYIFLIGVLEYAGSYLHAADPYEKELRIIRSHMAENGRLVIAIENRLGMKYWAGCAEDHSGRYFDGIESYADGTAPARTFSKPALEQLLCRSGAGEYSFYYPYPDYKFMSTLYSDRRLPKEDELHENIRNYDQDRLLLFDEKKAYQGVVEDGLYPMFANSFEVVVGAPLPVDYCKFSNDRAQEYQIRTEIDMTDGLVRKYPLNDKASAHVLQMEESAGRLATRYELPVHSAAGADAEEGKGAEHAMPKLPSMQLQGQKAQSQSVAAAPGLLIAPCRRTADGGVEFPLVAGRSLESLLDESLSRGDGEGFLSLLSEYRRRVGTGNGTPISDYDMTFSNILVNGNCWTAIDYEWAVPELIPVQELLFRSLLVYYLEDENRSKQCEALIGNDRLLAVIGIPEADANRLAEEEQRFQQQVTGGVYSLGKLRAKLGTRVLKPAELQTPEEIEAAAEAQRQKKVREERNLASIQVYYDTGRGFSEEESYWVEERYAEEGMVTFAVEITPEVRKLRVDPALCPCVVMIRDAHAGNAERNAIARLVRTNGRHYTNGSIVFTGMDPAMEWDLKRLRRKAGVPEGENFTLELTLQMAGLPSTMAKAMDER